GKKAGGAARRSPTPPEAGVSDDRVMNLDTFQAELEAKQALINEEFRVVQEENAKIANRLILMQPLNVNAVSNQSVAEELAAFEAESDPPSPSQDSRAAELAAQQQSAAVRAARITSASPNPPGAGSAAAGGDAVRAAVRNSARASSPGSESSRTESAADSLLAEQADEIEARAAGRSPARASSPGGALPQKKEEQSTKGLRTIIAQDPSGLTMPFRPISPVQQRAGDSPRKKINERSKGGLSVLATPQPKTMGVPEPSYAIEAGAAGRSPARASSPGGSRNAIEARATTPPQRTNSLGGALPQPGAGGGGGPLSNPPGAGGDSPAMRRQTRYEVIESINEKQIYFLINIAKGLQGKNKEEVTTLLTEIANKKPELYQQVLRDDDELGPAYSKHFIDEFYKDENSQSTQFIEALIADNNELRVIKTIFSTIKTRQQPIVHRDGPDQGASDEQGRAWTNCIFGGGARSNPTKATSTLEGDDISIASSTSSGAEHNPGRV
ncbi:MAG: hypothetical protein ISP24_04590, partial [Rickettsiales bacterium]|nr:hypothetical protein [Rickettsiales bacterium]